MGGKDKLEQSLELARTAGELRNVAMAYINLCGGLYRLGRYRNMARYADEGIEYCAEHGLDAWTKSLIEVRGEIELALGLWDQAAETATSIIDAPASPVAAVHWASSCGRWQERDAGTPTTAPRSSVRGRSASRSAICSGSRPAPPQVPNVPGSRAASRRSGRLRRPRLSSRCANAHRASLASSGLWRSRAGLLDERPADGGEPYSYQIVGDGARAAS
ncbi:MAG: hypothetical protein JO286_15415 [Solirubrobacterales bacterium]|nr:hypothetical protein [Solirubrobacterales bacterium]